MVTSAKLKIWNFIFSPQATWSVDSDLDDSSNLVCETNPMHWAEVVALKICFIEVQEL